MYMNLEHIVMKVHRTVLCFLNLISTCSRMSITNDCVVYILLTEDYRVCEAYNPKTGHKSLHLFGVGFLQLTCPYYLSILQSLISCVHATYAEASCELYASIGLLWLFHLNKITYC